MKMMEIQLRKLRQINAAAGKEYVVIGIDLALDVLLPDATRLREIPDAQLLPNGTLLASLTESYVKSYPDVNHPWRGTSGKVMSDMAMNSLIETGTIGLYRYGTGLDAEGNQIG